MSCLLLNLHKIYDIIHSVQNKLILTSVCKHQIRIFIETTYVNRSRTYRQHLMAFGVFLHILYLKNIFD